MTRVVVAMSGGVDSSIAAALMVEAGHEVIGLTMALYDAPGPGLGDATGERRGRGGTCCSPAEIDLARRVCDQLGIPHYTVDERARFEAAVIDDFAREYAAGRTPNPCARCNEHVKFGPLLARARALGATKLITGHYARIELCDDGPALLRARDPAKDQSYFLFAMSRELLGAVEFPLGDWTKQDVRAKAEALFMPNAQAPDSQELCFVPGGDHAEIVEARARALGLDLEALGPGEIRDSGGRVLGEHKGIHRITVGQRRGLGVTAEQPRYVLRVLPESRAVIVGEAEELAVEAIEIEDFRRLADLPEGEPFEATVQIRHRGAPSPATVTVAGDRAQVRFAAPVRAVAPGQAGVVYLGDRVLGGGWIG